eukprot:COSAG02_NODE_33802_length_494_cov_0.913924_1_plen_33_part_01
MSVDRECVATYPAERKRIEEQVVGRRSIKFTWW